MTFKPGDPRPPGAGRKPGQRNKLTKDMRAAIREAFDKAGGVEYLVKLSKSDPRTFIGIVRSIIPREIELESKGKGWEQLLDETLERARSTPRSRPGAVDQSPQRTPASDDGGAPGQDGDPDGDDGDE